MTGIQSFDRNTPIDEVMDTLERDGAAIYRNLLDSDTMDQIQADLDS